MDGYFETFSHMGALPRSCLTTDSSRFTGRGWFHWRIESAMPFNIRLFINIKGELKMKIKKIAMTITMCMVMGLQLVIPACAVEARYGVCPRCGGNVSVYNTTETSCRTYACTAHINCTVHETTTTTYRVRNCSGCSDSSKDPLKSDTVFNHLMD